MKRARVRSIDPVSLDVDVAGAVDHHLGDGGVIEELLDRTEAHDVAGDVLDQPLAFLHCQGRVVGVHDAR